MKNPFYPLLLLCCYCMGAMLMGCESDEDSPYYEKKINIGKDEYGLSLDVTDEGDAIICGHTSSVMSSNDMLVIKMSSDGIIMWMKTLGGSQLDVGVDITLSSEKNYLLAGLVTNNNLGNIGLIKLNPLGQLIWAKYYNINGYPEVQAIYPNNQDGCYMIAYVNGDMKILNFSGFGDTTWVKSIGKFRGTDLGRSIIRKSNGNILLCGSTWSFYPNSTAFIVELNDEGNELWTSFIDLGLDCYISDISLIENDGIYLAGKSHLGGIYYKGILIKTDIYGNYLWHITPDINSINDGYLDIEKTPQDDFLLTGYAFADTLFSQHIIRKITKEGQTIWVKTFGKQDDDTGYESKILPSGDIFSVGTFYNKTLFNNDIRIVKCSGH